MENVISKNKRNLNQRYFDDFLTRDLLNSDKGKWNTAYVPMANILESNDDFRIELALPGMQKSDFKVELDNQVLTITSDVPQREKGTENFDFVQREFNFHSFSRSFQMPETIEPEKIDARYQNGLLTVFLPKKEEAKRKPVREINIS